MYEGDFIMSHGELSPDILLALTTAAVIRLDINGAIVREANR
jgi:hypothetical protein